jgi:hypothetical protein
VCLRKKEESEGSQVSQWSGTKKKIKKKKIKKKKKKKKKKRSF